MTKYVETAELISKRIRKGKKASFEALKKNFFFLLLCWFVTAVSTFAAWGVYVFIDFVGFFVGLRLDFLSAGFAIFGVLPLYVGNVEVARRVVKGEKADIYTLFHGYFNFKQFWVWFLFYVVSASYGWILTLALGSVADNTLRFFPFIKGLMGEKGIFYLSVLFEIATVISFFLNLCKSLYLLSRYKICETVKETKTFFEKNIQRYSKRKKYFRKYILSHLHFIVIILLARTFPIAYEAVVFTLVLGFLSLCVCGFSIGFEINIIKYKSERS